MKKDIFLIFFFFIQAPLATFMEERLPGAVDDSVSLITSTDVPQVERENPLSLEEIYQLRMDFEKRDYFHRSIALQGGGVRGAWSAAVLQGLQERLAWQLRDGKASQDFQQERNTSLAEWYGDNGLMPFHQIFSNGVATSTGSLLLGGLTVPHPDDPNRAKYTTEEILNFYRHQASDIFTSCSAENCRNNWCCRAPSCVKAAIKWIMCCGCCGGCRNGWGIFGPKYGSETLENILQNQFGEVRFKDTLIPIHFTTYDMLTNRPFYPGSYTTPNLKVWKGARGSSAAPTFFMPYEDEIELRDGAKEPKLLVDGGLVENFPIAQSNHISPHVVDDESQISFHRDTSLLIAIGTGEAQPLSRDRLKYGGTLSWIETVIDIATSAPDQSNEQRIREEMGERYFGLQSSLPADLVAMDDPGNVEKLIEHARAYVQASPEIARLLERLPGGEVYESRFEDKLEAYLEQELTE